MLVTYHLQKLKSGLSSSRLKPWVFSPAWVIILLVSSQDGCVFPFLYCLADRIRHDAGHNANDPYIFPADKKSYQIDSRNDHHPVYELKSHIRFIQLINNIDSAYGMGCVLDKLRRSGGAHAGTKLSTASFGGFSIAGIAKNFLYRSPDAIGRIVH